MENLKKELSIDLKQKQKEEAIKRLEILREKGLLKNVVDDFKKESLIYYSEQTKLGGILYWCTKENNAERYVKIIEEFEKEHDVTVYHVIHTYTKYGELLNLLYVTSFEKDWEQDQQDLKENYSFCYVVDLDDKIFSEFGGIGIEVANGGLIRSY